MQLRHSIALFSFLLCLFGQSLAGPVKGFIELDSIPNKIACSEKIVVAREKIPGEYFGNPSVNADYNLYETAIARDVYAKFEDNYDFLMVHPQGLITNANLIINQTTLGIGRVGINNTDTAVTRYAQNLKAFAEYGTQDHYQIYKRHPEAGSGMKSWVNVALHELEHTWCCAANGFFMDEKKRLPGHYHSGIQLFGNDSMTIDPVQVSTWFPGNEPNCSDINQADKKGMFSEFSQYLMGLRAPEDVMPIRTFFWDTAANVVDSKIGFPISVFGPSCAQAPDFISHKMVTINDVIRLNGERVPSYQNSQKNFNGLNVILVPYGVQLDTGLVGYLETVLDSLAKAWVSATDQRSVLGMGCDLNSGVFTPFVRSHGKSGFMRLGRRNEIQVRLDGGGTRHVLLELFDVGGKFIKTLYEAKTSMRELDIPIGSTRRTSRSGTYIVKLRLDGVGVSSKVIAVLE